MYRPWRPLGHRINPYPVIKKALLDEDGLKLNLRDYDYEIDIIFEQFVGMQIFDESTFQTMKNLNCLNDDELENPDNIFSPLWKSTPNHRREMYGVLGEALYEELYSYWIMGNDFIYLIDALDSEPIINVIS